MSDTIEIRLLQTNEECHATLEIQQTVWGFVDAEKVPSRLMVVAAHTGGLVLGAYAGGEMVGFSLSFAGIKADGGVYWHSHMTGIRPEFQNRGVGRALKMRQREEAIRCRIALVEWTFDPLETRNAFFNVERLGVIAREYLPNLYGITTSKLHGSLPTDRLVAEWHVDGPRARSLAAGRGPLPRTIVEEIPVSKDVRAWRSQDPARALAEQTRVRGAFERHFAEGLAVVGYRRTDEGGVFELGRLDDQPVAPWL